MAKRGGTWQEKKRVGCRFQGVGGKMRVDRYVRMAAVEALGTGEGRCHGVAERVRGAGAASANAARRTCTKHKGQLGLGDAVWGPLDISIAESRRVVMKGVNIHL